MAIKKITGAAYKKFLKSLPTKRMGAGALFFNQAGQLLIIKPSYKGYWSIPGGVVDQGESPRAACQREIKEEIGLTKRDLRFIAVDYTSANERKDESLQFLFYGGKLSAREVGKIKIDGEEIVDYKFVAPKSREAFVLLGGNKRGLARRFPRCLVALKKQCGIYLEDGK